MAESSDIRIVIGGKTLVVSSENSSENLQKIADYVNRKLNECRNSPGYANLSMDTRFMLLELNIGEDYIITKEKLDEALVELAQKNKDLYETKNKLSQLTKDYELAKNQVVELQTRAAENAAKIIKLETALKKK